MGSSQSEFQDQFYDRYSFIQLLEDTHYGQIKIYRKNFLNYDYIMILEAPMSELSEEQLNSLEGKLQLVRVHQTSNIMKLYHFRVLRENKMECQAASVRLYAEYFNHTLDDYLTALRSKRIPLSIDQVLYIIKSVVNALSALRRMRVWELELHTRNVFLSMEGEVFLSPLYFVHNSIVAKEHRGPRSIDKKYQKFSLKDHPVHSFPEKTHIRNLFLQLTAFLCPRQFSESNPLFNCIEKSPSLDILNQRIPDSKTEALLVEQIYAISTGNDKNNELYSFE